MNITGYIIEFLKDRGSVTVPGFGEFFLKNSKAVVDEDSKSILPPAKEIGFTVDYQAQNDDLKRYISTKSGVDFSETESELSKLTTYWKNQLAENHQLSVENLGTFYQSEDELHFKGIRIENTTPDFYGLEEIDLKNLNSASANDVSKKEYRTNKPLFWAFLILSVLGLAFFAFTQRDTLFGKKSFNNSIPAAQKIKVDSAKIKREKLEIAKADSLRLDSLKQDSIRKIAGAIYNKPVRKYNPKKYNSKKWSKSRKRATR